MVFLFLAARNDRLEWLAQCVHVPKTQLHIWYRNSVFAAVMRWKERLASISMKAVRFCPVVYVLVLAAVQLWDEMQKNRSEQQKRQRQQQQFGRWRQQRRRR